MYIYDRMHIYTYVCVYLFLNMLIYIFRNNAIPRMVNIGELCVEQGIFGTQEHIFGTQDLQWETDPIVNLYI